MSMARGRERDRDDSAGRRRATPQADLIQLYGFTGSGVMLMVKRGGRDIATMSLSLEEAREFAVSLYALADECDEGKPELVLQTSGQA